MVERLIEVHKHIDNIKQKLGKSFYPEVSVVDVLAVANTYVSREKAILIFGDSRYGNIFREYLKEYHSFYGDIWEFDFENEFFLDDPMAALMVAEGIVIKESEKSVFLLVNEDIVYRGEFWKEVLRSREYNLGNLILLVGYMALYIKSTMLPLADKWRAFGWDFHEVNAQNVSMIFSAIERSIANGSAPSAVLLYAVADAGFESVVDLL